MSVYSNPLNRQDNRRPENNLLAPEKVTEKELVGHEVASNVSRPPPGQSNQPGRLGRGSGNSDRVFGANRVVWALSEAVASESNNAVGGAWCPACVIDSRRHRQGLETCTSVAEGASSGTNLAWRSIATSHHAGGHFNSVL
jgi:hypothetical protein